MNLRLALLALRRALSPSGVLPLLALALVCGCVPWSAPAELLPGYDAELVRRSLTRQGVWSALLLLAGPLLVLRAAGVVGHWRRGEVDWLAAAPIGAGSVLFSTWLGTAAAALVIVTGIGAAAELTVGAVPAAGGLRLVDRLPAPGVVLDVPDRTTRFEVELGREVPGSRVRLYLRIVAGAPAATVRWALVRGEVRHEEVLNVVGRAFFEAPVPPGTGPLEVELERLGEGAMVATDGAGLERLAPVGSERAAGLTLASWAVVGLAALLALALGLGAWVGTPFAAGLSLALLVPPWFGGLGSRAWWPWGDLPGTLALVGEGLAPPGVPPRTLAGAAAVVVLGIALGKLDLQRRWRRET